jgi:hypothetical protein
MRQVQSHHDSAVIELMGRCLIALPVQARSFWTEVNEPLGLLLPVVPVVALCTLTSKHWQRSAEAPLPSCQVCMQEHAQACTCRCIWLLRLGLG